MVGMVREYPQVSRETSNEKREYAILLPLLLLRIFWVKWFLWPANSSLFKPQLMGAYRSAKQTEQKKKTLLDNYYPQ